MNSAFGVDHGDISKAMRIKTPEDTYVGGSYGTYDVEDPRKGIPKLLGMKPKKKTAMVIRLQGQKTGKPKYIVSQEAKGHPFDPKKIKRNDQWSSQSQPVSKAEKPPMAPDKLRHKKKVSAGTSIVSSTLGIAGLGAMVAGKSGPRLAGRLVKHPKLMAKAPKKMKVLVNDQKKVKQKSEKAINTAWGLSTAAAGVGGIGGYNYASIQRAEARKKRL